MHSKPGSMPKHLKLLSRIGNSGAIFLLLLFATLSLGKGNAGFALILVLFAALYGFNLYLVEKSATLLSEEEWLQSEVRKALLRRKLARMAEEDEASAPAAPTANLLETHTRD